MQNAFIRISVITAGVWIASLNLPAQTAPGKEMHSVEGQGIPARATPADYQQHMKVGAVTIAAEFIGHFVPTSDGTLTTEEYVQVEVAFFGGPNARLNLSPDNFSIRINGKKPLPSQPYGMVVGNLKDPDWAPPASAAKSKTSINGSGDADSGPPPPVHIPIEVQRSMAQRTERAALAEGDRALPQGGLLFFPYHGKGKDIRSVELSYNGPAGQGSMALQP